MYTVAFQMWTNKV